MRSAWSTALVLATAALSFGAGPAGAVSVAAADLRTVAEADRPFMRYTWHPGPRSLIDEFEAVGRFHANQLSRKAVPTAPFRVAADLWRLDLRHYGWNAATWEKFRNRNVYFTERRRSTVLVTKGYIKVRRPVSRFVAAKWLPAVDIAYLMEETNSEVPMVMAPWWLVQTCRQLTLTNEHLGFGYYDFLGIKNRNDFFRIARFRIKDSRELELDLLEAVSKSGVSKQNRQIDREQALTGGLWFTLDTDNETGRGNAIRNLKRGDYKHKAEEIYLRLPNGLPAYLLCDAEGVLQPSAPDFIGPDRSALNVSTDGRIHACLACIRCHAGDVLQPIDGWARKNYTAARLALLVPAGFKKLDRQEQFQVFEDLKRQYFSNLQGALEADRQAYRQAFLNACGLPPAELAPQFARAYHRYADTQVDLDQAARELGCTANEVRIAFRTYSGTSPAGTGAIDPELGGLVVIPGEPINRLHWEDLYAQAQKIMMGYQRGGRP